MVTLQRHRTAWIPVTEDERAEVRAELDVVLSHPHFAHSKRYPALLRYLVQHTLDGDVSRIKERTLGIEVFGRPATYDTTNDTVVRFTAGEVRRRLATFYLQHEDHTIHIALPTGSYVPEFLRAEEAADLPKTASTSRLELEHQDSRVAVTLSEEPTQAVLLPATGVTLPPVSGPASALRASTRRRFWAMVAVCVLILLAAVDAAWKLHSRQAPPTAVDRFWRPLTHDQRAPLLIAGGNIFSNNPYSGTETATREVDYPFVSMQIAFAMSRTSAILQREGGAAEIQAASATTLNDLRDHPLVLIGGYNNVWTSRLTERLPLHFAPVPAAVIVEQGGEGRQWQRDRTLPYGSADDFALIGQFRDTITGNLVVLMAGIGRNGSEAAAQFLTDERRLQSLQQAAGQSLDGRNFEAVLRVPVIQGRTGSPTILAVRSW